MEISRADADSLQGRRNERGKWEITTSVLQTSHLDCALAGGLHVIRGQ